VKATLRKYMSKKIFLFITLITCFGCAYPQTTTKFDLRLTKRLKEGRISDINMPLLVKGDLNKIKNLVKNFGGVYKYGYNNIASIEIPEKNLVAFSLDNAIEKIEHTGAKGVFLMDTARIRNNIDSVQAGFAPLTDSTTGKNVIVGIIDGGIYWQHKDFKNHDGTTRIMYIWDQTVPTGANAPHPYLYGNEWNWLDIDAGNCTEVEPYEGNCEDFSHGTCVAGIAAGNGSADSANPHLAGVYTGVAPESNLIIVNVGSGNCYNNFEPQVADAVDYIFKKADALGMPCVINTSVGTYYGSHDGLDLTTQTIENLLDQRNGRVLVAAAGNGGEIPYHLSYDIPSDSTNPAYTFFNYNPYLSPNPGSYFDLWADTVQFNNAWFAVGCNDALGEDLGRTGYLNVPISFNNLAQGVGSQLNIPLFYGNTLLGSIDVQVTLDGQRYHVEFSVNTPASTSYLWRLQTYGSGTFDLWASSSLIGSSDMLDSIAGSGGIITDANYRHPDSLKTIVSEWQCSSKVITVGNYSNRAGYFDYDSNYVSLSPPNYGDVPEVVGKIFYTSSLGPTRDNRLKPDVMATGSTILCTGDANDLALKLANPSLHYKVALGGKHERNGGTSMASPIVAGIAALYLQKRPTATYNEIMTALICTAVSDSFTGQTPNYSYGNGKVNAFQALTKASCITYGAQDTSCINYNALANVDTGGCVAKVYGCTDVTASNYDSTANINAGNCIYTSIKNITGNEISLQLMPNPFSDQTTFNFIDNGYSFAKGEIDILDQLGRVVDALSVNESTTHYTYSNQKLQQGIYYYVLKLDGKNVKTGKLCVE